MPKVVVASSNPVKLLAVEAGFSRMFPSNGFEVISVNVSSGISDQPMSNEETLLGAENRAHKASLLGVSAEYWVGIEGGIEEQNQGMAAYAWVVVKSQTLTGRGRTGTFYLPTAVAGLVRQGKELGEADDIIFGQENSKQKNGAVGILTGDVITRATLYEHAIILALVPFKNIELYE